MAALLGGRAAALDPSRTLSQLNHTSWTAKDGAPAAVYALAQTPDGYIWLGSDKALYRFDGKTFENMANFRDLPARSDGVLGLMTSKTGELWVGHMWGGVSVYRNGHFVDVNPAPAPGSVFRIVQDPSGAIWVEMSGQQGSTLWRFANDRWDVIDTGSWGIPKAHIYDILPARDGTIWLALSGGLMRLSPGSTTFEPVGEGKGDVQSLAQTADGVIWGLSLTGMRRLTLGDGPGRYLEEPPPGGKSLGSILVDRDGSLWWGGQSHGVSRLRHPELPNEPVEDSAFEQILSDSSGGDVLEDKEGNIWVGTVGGIDRFQAVSFVPEAPSQQASNVLGMMNLVPARDGDVYGLWNDSQNSRLFHEEAGKVTDLTKFADQATALCAAADGGFWMFRRDHRVVHMKGDRVIGTLRGPGASTVAEYRNCAEDGAGRLWVSLPGAGLFRFDGKSWAPFNIAPELKWPRLQVVDRQGRVIMYFSARSVYRIDGDAVEKIWDRKDISISYIQAMYVVGEQLFLCGDGGLALYDGNGFKVLDAARFPFFQHLTGIARTDSGEMWIIGTTGVVRLSYQDLMEAFDHPDRVLHPRIFNYQDGLRGEGMGLAINNTIAAARHGRIWFSTTGGVEWLDPAHLYRNDLPPPVSIRFVRAGNTQYRPEGRLILPEGVSNLQIDYTAPSFTAPERVAFRYRLEGFDKDWIDAGSRRQAFYTNLAPGSYRFHVIAANNDGVWNQTGAAVDLEIPPTFLQSKLFIGLCAAAALGILLLLYHLRIRQIAWRLRLRFNARIEERERIARELHDTLLQSVQGLIFRFQAVAGQIPPEQPTRQQMECALDQADQLLAEGRDRLIDLRAGQAAGDLAKLFSASSTRILAGTEIAVSLSVEGTPRELLAPVAEEIMRIGDEFLFNTLKHAEARKIGIAINYGRKTLAVHLSDDGRGIDAAILVQGEREGHFGLRGMRERAQKIGGSFTLMSRPGAGVELTIAIPASVAYPRSGQNRRSAEIPMPTKNASSRL